MKYIAMMILTALLAAACSKRVPETVVVEHLNAMTPVKDQGQTQSCWIYAMLAAIETEHIGQGDSVNLSAAWIESLMADDRRAPQSGRGMGATLLQLLQEYGVVGYDAMRSADRPRPKAVYLYGAEYTPLEFAHSVCRADEYVALTSNGDSAYGRQILVDKPDNWLRQRFLNVPIDTLLRRTVRAVRQGRGVCWESRHHAMAVVGLARDTLSGERYLVMKNSWGKDYGDHGLDYLSFSDFRMKTLAVCMPAEAFGETAEAVVKHSEATE